MTYLMAFGGGIIAPFLLGKPPVMFVNDLIVPLVCVIGSILLFSAQNHSTATALFVDLPDLMM